MKKTAIALLTVVVLLFTGCSNESPKTDKTAAELLDVVMNSVQFPQMINLTDEVRISDMGIDLSLAEDYAIKQQMLSVDVCEVIIIKAKDGMEGEILDSLEERMDSLINDFAFYPEQVESAEATVVGVEKDVVYLICHKDADVAEGILLEEI